MRASQAYTVVGVAIALAVLAFVLAGRERVYHDRFTSSLIERQLWGDAPYLARHPWVAGGGTFALGLVGGCVVVIAANTTKHDRPD